MAILANLVSGLLFGAGLVVSGLINPAKVLNFLDVAGSWDPSLAFTMAGAVVTAAIGYRLVFARGRPLLEPAFQTPSASAIDQPLVAGAALFGIGWGLVGYCPGPAVAGLALGGTPTLIFVIAMVAGMVLARTLLARPAAASA